LAHIRRFDLWVNLFQRLLETLLFYHPAVWWLSRRVRLTREMCCDELAAAATGERVAYASALELAARRRLVPARSVVGVALGVTRMTLLRRVRNVLGLAAESERDRWWPAAVLALLVPPLIWFCPTAVTSAQEKKPTGAAKAVREGKPAARPKYTATATFQVRFPSPTAAEQAAEEEARDRFEIYKATHKQLVVSRFVLQAALREPGVAKLPAIQREQKSGDPVRWLKSRLHVTFPGNAEIMELSLTADDADQAVTLLRAVVDAYLHEVVNAEQDRKRARLAAVDRAVADKEKEIRTNREALKKLATTLGTSATGNLTLRQKLALEELAAYRAELARVQSDVRRLKAELAAQQAALKVVQNTPVTAAEVDAMMQQDPIGRQLSTELGWKKLDQVYMDNAVVKFPTNSHYVDRYQKALKTLQTSYDARKAELIEGIRQKERSPIVAEVCRLGASLAALAEQERAIESLVEKEHAEATKLGNDTVDMQMLQLDIRNAESVLNQLVSQRDKLRAENRAGARITLFEPPAKPTAPDD
jgi:hypothetical protein